MKWMSLSHLTALAVLAVVPLGAPAGQPAAPPTSSVPPPPPPPAPPAAPAAPAAPSTIQLPPGTWQTGVPMTYAPTAPLPAMGCAPATSGRGFLESDRCFPGFIGPITNPILAKDPRALTEARLLFINNEIDPQSAIGSGDFQVLGLQVRAALTDRLSFIADKDGYAWLHARGLRETDGWLNVAAGLKYAVIRDVEDQFLVTVGVQFEPQTGEQRVFSDLGTGIFTGFVIVGKEFGGKNHVLANIGYELPVDQSQNSTYFYTSLHLDRQLMGWLYPLVEVNWFHYDKGGDHGLPRAVGEGDGLLDLGTSGMAGHDLVTGALGLKAQVNEHLDVGTAYELPLTRPRDLLGNRLLVEMIFRY